MTTAISILEATTTTAPETGNINILHYTKLHDRIMIYVRSNLRDTLHHFVFRTNSRHRNFGWKLLRGIHR